MSNEQDQMLKECDEFFSMLRNTFSTDEELNPEKFLAGLLYWSGWLRGRVEVQRRLPPITTIGTMPMLYSWEQFEKAAREVHLKRYGRTSFDDFGELLLIVRNQLEAGK